MKRKPLGSTKKDNKTVANKREKRQASEIGGIRVPQSGAFSDRKGDIEVKDFLLDSKHTSKQSILISQQQLGKITQEAREQAKRPGLLIELQEPPFGTPSSWVLIPQNDFKELIK